MAEPLTEKDLADVLGGYRLSSAVVAMADLRIPDALAVAPRTAAVLAADLGLAEEPLGLLLNMLAAWGALTRREDGSYANTGLSAALVTGEARDMALGWRALPGVYAAWGGLAEGVRTGRPPFETVHGGPLHAYFDDHPGERAGYYRAMASTMDDFEDVAALLDLAPAATVVSVGGGRGAELVPILRRRPDLTAVLTDLPDALAGAGELLAAHGVAERVTIVPADARVAVPSGDAYVLSTVLRCMGDTDALAVLSACRRAARPGAAVHLIEMPIPEGPPEPPTATAALTAWVVYGGADRTLKQWAGLLGQAGWPEMTVQEIADGDPFRLISGR